MEIDPKYHSIVKELKSAQQQQGEYDNYFCQKCGKRWENMERNTASQIDLNGCER